MYKRLLIGLGIGVGVIAVTGIAGYMIYKKMAPDYIDDFDDDFDDFFEDEDENEKNSSISDIFENFEKVMDESNAKVEKAEENFQATKQEVLTNISKRHDELNKVLAESMEIIDANSKCIDEFKDSIKDALSNLSGENTEDRRTEFEDLAKELDALIEENDEIKKEGSGKNDKMI